MPNGEEANPALLTALSPGNRSRARGAQAPQLPPLLGLVRGGTAPVFWLMLPTKHFLGLSPYETSWQFPKAARSAGPLAQDVGCQRRPGRAGSEGCILQGNGKGELWERRVGTAINTARGERASPGSHVHIAVVRDM